VDYDLCLRVSQRCCPMRWLQILPFTNQNSSREGSSARQDSEDVPELLMKMLILPTTSTV